MKILYVDEESNYSEVFVNTEKEYLESESFEIETLFLKELRVSGYFFKNLYIFFICPLILWDMFMLLFLSLNNFRRFLSNLHAIALFVSNINILKSYSSVCHIRSHFLAKRSTVSLLMSRYLSIPFSMVAHAKDIFEWDSSILYKMKRSQYVHAISNYNIGYLNARSNFKYSGKIHLIRNSFDTNVFELELVKTTGKSVRFVLVARLINKKGILEFLDIFKVYCRDFNFEARLDIIGDGPLEGEIKAYIDQHHLCQNVQMLGVLNNTEVQKVMINSSYLVLLAKNATINARDMDGIPTVFFEALGVGLPVISTEVSGIPELLNDGVNSILIDTDKKPFVNAEIINQRIVSSSFDSKRIRRDFRLFLSGRFGAEVFLKMLRDNLIKK
jgi:colanic acid/amylovoran biosynthesis glycosyltransferase